MVEKKIQFQPLAPKPIEIGRFNEPVALIEQFMAAKTKIAIQKDGELTDISRAIYREKFGIDIPPFAPNSQTLVNVSEGGQYGFLYARNKEICNLVAKGSVNQAVVGIDRLLEDDPSSQVMMVAEFPEYGLWSIVIATPANRGYQSIKELRRVATKYPELTKAFFGDPKNSGVEVIAVNGGSEMYTYIDYGDGLIDAVVDLTDSGTSLRQHGLVAWDPPITEVYPVLIQKRNPIT